MKMVQLMAKMVQERIEPIVLEPIGFDTVPKFLTPRQRVKLGIDIIPVPIALRLFSSDEVAELFSIHARTVRKWAARGWIKVYRPYPNVAYYKGYELLALERYIHIVAK